ncbi:MAG: M15 family metallopeptidase [Pseudomonadota bacterium]
MTQALSARQLTGRDDTHLVEFAAGQHLQAEAAAALQHLVADAAAGGFELAVASSFRSYDRQLAIWNGKACGKRAVHDDAGCAVDISTLGPVEQLHALLRFSALPGASRHHWGTDLDVFDAAALTAGQSVQLVPAEVAPGGVFDPLHRWLDERMAAGDSYGFYRPYAWDRDGVAPERWHLSYAPLALHCEGRLDEALLRDCWDDHTGTLALRDVVEQRLASLLQRYVVISDDWCPRQSPKD